MLDDSERGAWQDWQRWLERHSQAWRQQSWLLNGGCLRGAHVASSNRLSETEPAMQAARRRAALGLHGWRRR